MLLGREVGLGPGHIVLDGDPAPPPQRGTAPYFRSMSVVAKRLDGSSCHLIGRQTSAQATQSQMGTPKGHIVLWGPRPPGRSQTVAHLSQASSSIFKRLAACPSPLKSYVRPLNENCSVRIQKNVLYIIVQAYVTMYTVIHKRRDILFLTITLTNLKRFSQFLYHFYRGQILHSTVVKFITSPY